MKFVPIAPAGFSLFATAASANAVVDGNFSRPYGGATYTEFLAGSAFGPWTVVNGINDAVGSVGSVDLIGGYWQSPTGPLTGSVDLDGATPGGIEQTLTLRRDPMC